MQIIFDEIFVPQDFTIRLLLGSVDPQTRVPRCFMKKYISKTRREVSEMKWWTPPALPAPTHPGQDVKKNGQSASERAPSATKEHLTRAVKKIKMP